jgi:hypothetical protein
MAPTGPPSREQDPQEPIGTLEAQTRWRVLLENRELVTKREDLRLKAGASSKTGGDKSENGDEESTHRNRKHLMNVRNLCVFSSDGVFGTHQGDGGHQNNKKY